MVSEKWQYYRSDFQLRPFYTMSQCKKPFKMFIKTVDFFAYLICFLFVMAALWNRAGHYILVLWFLLSSFFFFLLAYSHRRRLDVYHTSTHGVALVRI